MNEELAKLRKEIERLDTEIITALAKRFRIVEEIMKVKREEGVPFEDKAREEELMNFYEQVASKEKIDQLVVRRVMSYLLKMSKDSQL